MWPTQTCVMTIDETTDDAFVEPSTMSPVGPRTVMVPVDGSTRADRALRPGRRLADALGVPIGAVTVTKPGTEGDRSMLESAVADHRLQWSEVIHAEDVGEALVADALDRTAIISMATGGRGRSVAIVGSTAVDVVKHSTLPVMLVGAATEIFEDQPINELVVAVSGRTSGESICTPAIELATTFGFAVHFVTVVQPTPEPADSDSPAGRSFGPAGDEHEYMADLVKRFDTPELGLTGSVIYDPLSPAGGLAPMMRRRPQSVLVLGTKSRTGMDRLRRGSIASRIVSESPVPSIMLPLLPA